MMKLGFPPSELKNMSRGEIRGWDRAYEDLITPPKKGKKYKVRR